MSNRPANRRFSGLHDEDFDKHFDRIERNSGRIIKGFGVLWVLSFVLSLAFMGLIVWAIISLVTHFTG